jgi:small subunit ribosomal protein S4
VARLYKAVCRLCRREGTKLFLKGTKCVSEKCPLQRRDYAPGQHGQTRPKLSNYGLQLREKQKVKRMYGVLERQFRRYFRIAAKSKGITGKILLQILERRLDNVVFRCNFALSRRQARQFTSHGFIYVNNRRVNIPSFLVKEGDVIELKAKDKTLKNIQEFIKQASNQRTIPSWLEVDTKNLKARVLRLPEKEDLQVPIKEQLIVELYSK